MRGDANWCMKNALSKTHCQSENRLLINPRGDDGWVGIWHTGGGGGDCSIQLRKPAGNCGKL